MKNRCVVFLIILALLMSITLVSAKLPTLKEITGRIGKIITGKASSQTTNVSLVVDGTPPDITTILQPHNRTALDYPFNFFNSHNITLKYNATDLLSQLTRTWYQLDASGSNVTLNNNPQTQSIQENTTVNVSNGMHDIKVYANDSANNINSTSMNFQINNSLGNFACPVKYNGTTTNFTDLAIQGDSATQNITDLVLEIENHGKIQFNGQVNISRDLCTITTTKSSLIDAESDIFTKATPIVGFLYINPNLLPELNTSATITLYNLGDSFTDPQIQINGGVCDPNKCVIQSNNATALVFNVTYAGASFFIEETPDPTTTTTVVTVTTRGSGGGGGGGVISIASEPKQFSIDKTIKVQLKQGETKTKIIKVSNTHSEKVSIFLHAPGLERFITIEENSFDLSPGESKEVSILFHAKENEFPDLYIGDLIIKTGQQEERILVAISVESKEELLDVKLDIPKGFLTVPAGEELLFTILLFNFGTEDRVDVLVEYIIKDEDGNIIARETETLAVQTQLNAIKQLKIPESTNNGRYILYIKVTDPEGKVASATSFFTVGKRPILTGAFLKLGGRGSLTITALIAVLIISLVIYFKRKKKHKK